MATGDDEGTRDRVRDIATSLPEVQAEEGQHIGFRVRGRTFAWYLDDHHGDGRQTLAVKAAPGAQQALIGSAPELFHAPKFLGARGWVGIDLEAPALDWAEVAVLIKDAYRLTAPKRLIAAVE